MEARRALFPLAATALLALGAARPEPARAEGPPPTVRVAFVGPTTGPLARSASESLAGLRHAVTARGADGVKGRRVEVLVHDDRDDPSAAEKAYAAAVAAKAEVIVAASTGRTLEALSAKARKGKTPVMLVGSAGPTPTLDPATPLLFAGGWPVDQALALASFLAVPCESVRPGIVVEDSPRGAEVEAALRRNVGPRQTVVGTVRVPAGAPVPAAGIASMKAALCDRLVVIGEPDLVDRAREAAKAAAWDVPLLGGDGTLVSGAPGAAAGKAKPDWFLVGLPQFVTDRPPRALDDAHEAASPGASMPPRTITAFAGAHLLLEGLATAWRGAKAPKEAEVLAATRDVRYGPEESKMPMLDLCGRAALVRWRVWTEGKRGPEPLETSLLPIEGFGPLLRGRPASLYAVEPGTKVCWVTFGDAESKPARTIEKDMGLLGLGTRGYEGDLDGMLLDELMVRALGKLNRMFLKNEDGTGIPGVSFAISFTPERPAKAKPSEYWTMVIAGDDADAGGRAFPGENRAEVYATFLRRTIFQPNALEPRMTQEDKRFVDATYVRGLWKLQHLRADAIRCLVDGYAGAFALTGAHELGHLAGLGHDEEDPRSIMNVTEGVGLRETQAWWIPSHAAVLERVLGRWPSKPAR